MLYAFQLLLLSLAALLPAPQTKAKLDYFARADGDQVRAVVRVRVSPNWHLYATDLGDANAVGTPAKLKFSGEGVTWGEARWPEPEPDKQEFGMDGNPATANIHHGTVLVYAVGRLEEGARVDGWSVQLTGQVCEEGGQCQQLDVAAQVQSPGSDSLFEKFPSDLAAPKVEAPFEAFEDPDAHAKVSLFARMVDGEARAVLRVELDPEWHLYHENLGKPDAAGLPTTIELAAPGVEWEKPIWPTPHEVAQEYGLEGEPTTILQHDGTFVVYARGRVASDADLAKAHVEVTGQTCDANMCLQFRAAVASSGAGDDALFAEFPARSDAATSDGVDERAGTDAPEEDGGLLQFLGLAVLGGLLALLMPCTYPMIPITISFFTKQAAQHGGARLQLSLLYGIGIVAMFILIGLVVGQPIIQFAQHPTTNLIFATVFVIFGLSLLGMFNLQPPAFLMNMAGQARSTGGYLGVFLMGATLVITSFTCTAPIVGAILTATAGSASVDYTRVVLGMGAFGLTMAAPFVFLSLLPGKLSAIPRSGE